MVEISKREWGEKIFKALQFFLECKMCPHECGVKRLQNNFGFCGKNLRCDDEAQKVIASAFELGEQNFCDEIERDFIGTIKKYFSCYKIALKSAVLHTGEEPVFSSQNGVGNLFFCGCNCHCLFCQNFQISQGTNCDEEDFIDIFTLAEKMVALQSNGASHIGLVSPSHLSLFILIAVAVACNTELSIPIIYNTNGYEKIEVLKIWEGVVSIYLPDFKYGNNELAKKYSCVENYCEVALSAIREMVRQVGSNLILEDGKATRGIIVRHLVLPRDQSDTRAAFEKLSAVSTSLTISLMAQYFPTFKASDELQINRPITETEYENAIAAMEDNLFFRGFFQELESNKNYRPEFDDKEKPFL